MTKRSRRTSASRGRIACYSLLALSLAGGAFWGVMHWGRRTHAIDIEGRPRAVVRRANLFSTLRAPGRVSGSMPTGPCMRSASPARNPPA